MNDQQVAELATFMQATWPKNDMDDSEVQSWRRILRNINVPDAARQALLRLKDSTGYSNPNRATFLEILRKQTGGAIRSHEPMPEAWPGYVQNMETGHFVPLCYAGDRPDDFQVNQHLQFMRDDHQRMYGGEWQIVRELGRDVTVREMIDRRQQIRGTVPIDEQRRRKRENQPSEAEYKGVPVRTEPKPEPTPAPHQGPTGLRGALNDFFKDKPVKHQGPPPAYLNREPEPDDAPPASDDEAGQYSEQDEPFE